VKDYKDVVNDFLNLSIDDRLLAMKSLIEDNIVNYTVFTQYYVEWLREQRERQDKNIYKVAEAGLNLVENYEFLDIKMKDATLRTLYSVNTRRGTVAHDRVMATTGYLAHDKWYCGCWRLELTEEKDNVTEARHKPEYPNSPTVPKGYLFEGCQTYFGAVLNNIYFQRWYKDGIGESKGFDVSESVECGVMGDNHFQAFLDWVVEQSKVSKKGKK
jgi:predicted transcriptional regulator